MISLAARGQQLAERPPLTLRRQTIIGHALSAASPHFHSHLARQRHPAQVDLAVIRDDAALLLSPVARAPNGTGLPRWVSVIRIFIPTCALKLARTIAPWAGTTLTTASTRSTLSRQGVGVQRDPVFAILGGIGQDGIPAPVGAYPGLVFHLHAAGAGAFTSTTVSFNGWLR